MNTEGSLSDDHESIPLEDEHEVFAVVTEDLDLASLQDFSAWQSAYQSLMAKSIGYAHWLLRSKEWRLVYNVAEDRFRLFELTLPAEIEDFATKPNATYHTVKVSGVMNVKAERLMYVIADHDSDTRLKWDSDDLASISEVQTFKTDRGDIKVVLSEIKSPFPLIANRVVLGIMWRGYTAATKTYKLIFRSTIHWLYKVAEHQVALDGLIAVVVRVLDSPTPSCEVIIVAHLSLGGTVPSVLVGLLKERLRQRLELYERVTKRWNDYYGPSRNPKLIANRKKT